MEPQHKKVLKAISLELRHLLEGQYDSAGDWRPGDLEQRLAAIGVRRDREPVSVDEMPHLSAEDRAARAVVDAFLEVREDAEAPRREAVAEFVRETAYTWANRLLALRCMEARELIDEVILQKEAYGGRSLEHHRLAQRQPELCAGEDDGMFAVLDKVFAERAQSLPIMFDPQSPAVALRPSPAALKRALELLSGTEAVRSYDPATTAMFQAPDALGWAYQYWNTEEKDRVFERVRTQKGAKIAGADIIPATQLYTEPYMVKFLVQNSLGATWMGMHPDSKLCETWDYYVRDADRAPVDKKPVAEVTFLDPACGSGHFLLEAFDLYYDMYFEEGQLTEPEDVCRSILEKNLFGIDIDARAVQIAEAALWMKAAERTFDFRGAPTNLVAAVATHLKGDLWEEFLAGFEREPSVVRVLRKFGQAMEHIDELGSLARPEEELRAIIREEHAVWERQLRERKEANYLFPEMVEDALSGHLPFHEVSDEEFGARLLYRARAAIDAFTVNSREQGTFQDQFLGRETREGFKLLDLLSGQYDVVAANPPYVGFRKVGARLLEDLKSAYPSTYADVYTAFIERACHLATAQGFVAMVTLSTWLSLEDFRAARSTIFDCCLINSMAVLGTGTFRDLSNTNAMSFCMFVLAANRTLEDQACFVDCSLSRDKCQELISRIRDQRWLCRSHSAFCVIPGTPIAHAAPESVLRAFSDFPPFRRLLRARQGLKTGDNNRFVRFVWECPASNWRTRWFPCTRGGPYRRWRGNYYAAADWELDGIRLRNFFAPSGRLRSRPQNTDMYFRGGITWTTQTSYGFSARVANEGLLIESSGPLAIPNDAKQCTAILGILNARLIDFLFNLLQPKAGFGEGYLEKIPAPPMDSQVASQLHRWASSCVTLAELQEITDIDSAFARPSALFGDQNTRRPLDFLTRLLESWALRHTVEGQLEELVCQLYGFVGDEAVYQRVGKPVGWYPPIEGYVSMPEGSAVGPSDATVLEACGQLAQAKDVVPAGRVAQIKCTLRQLFEAGPSAKEDDDTSPEALLVQGQDEYRELEHPVPTETFLELLSHRLQIHPLSLYWIIRDALQCDEWRCLPEERRIILDRMSVVILHHLGHRWPTQIEAGEPVPEWADADGIIPLTEGTDEPTLLQRVRERIAADFEGGDVASIEREFAEIMGKPLEQWLSMEFFKHHTRQFKKRPIAWQIQSGRFTARRSPAFACLVYYHKLDGDLLPKIRTQYVGPLRQRMETELRGIESVAADARNVRQDERRLVLEAQIDELREFDAALGSVIQAGFASKELSKLLKDETPDRWCSLDGRRPEPEGPEAFLQQESRYFPDINDGVRVNIAPLQKAGLLAADVLSRKDLDKAIADRAQWRSDERRWCREGKLPQPGWWPQGEG